MPDPTHRSLVAYRHRLINLDDTRKRMEALYASKDVRLRDVLVIYESLFLRAVTGFETYCESLFFEVMQGQTKYSKRRVSHKVTAKSGRAMREFLLRGEEYLKWLPYSNTERRAALCLNGGRPFTELDDGDRSQLKTIVTIRNAIAHSSDHATQKFIDDVIGNQNLLPSERTPAGFLRSPSTPGHRKFEVYTTSLLSIATKVLGKPLS